MKNSLQSILAIIAISSIGHGALSPSVPVNIGARLELFVDDVLIDEISGLAFMLHPPSPAEVALTFDQPWEGSGNHYPTIIKDDDRFRMYYHSVVPKTSATSVKDVDWVSYTCYAESKDGVTWTRPDLNLVEFQGSRKNNIVHRAMGFPDGAMLFPQRNLKPGAPPDQRYLAAGVDWGHGRYRLHVFSSADGVRWNRFGDRPVLDVDFAEKVGAKSRDKGSATDTYYHGPNLADSDGSLFWDAPSRQYFLYVRDQWLAPGTGERIRGIRRLTSPDLKQWSYPQWIQMHPSPPDEFYTNSIAPYFRAPHFHLAFPMRFLPHRDAVLPAEYDAGRGKGLSDAVFMSSRDGLHWDRRFLEAFIRPGIDPLRWTDRSNHISLGLVPTGPAEMSVFVLEYFRLPHPRFRRYVMRTDGIASINAPYRGGEFTTKPILFSGRRLLINASTSAAGGIRVELLDAAGRPFDRFATQNAIEFFGDSIEQEVRWDQGPDVSSVAGQPVRLRFLMKDADLYSFKFTD